MTVVNLLLNFLLVPTIAVITTPHPQYKASFAVAYGQQTLQEGTVVLLIKAVHFHCRDQFESSDERTNFQLQRWNYDKMEMFGHQAVCKNTYFVFMATFNETVDD